MNSDQPVRIEEDGDDFVIHKDQHDGTIKSLSLSANDVMLLAQSAPSLRQRILSKMHSTADFSPVFATPTSGILVHNDALEENVLVSLLDRSGQGALFEIAPHLAEELARSLLARVAEMKSAKPKAQ